jgi:hypothetical protein
MLVIVVDCTVPEERVTGFALGAVKRRKKSAIDDFGFTA